MRPTSPDGPGGYAAPGGAAPDLARGASEALLPVAGAGFTRAFLLAALRPDAARWLGRDGLGRLAAPLGMRAAALAALLDTAPPPPALGENGPWSGLRVPVHAKNHHIDWIELCWRPDRAALRRRQDQGSFALRLVLPETGRVEIRGRLEGSRLDAVMEIERMQPRPRAAALSAAFDEVLGLLGLEGVLTVRNGPDLRRA
ncbi:hypothetical protein [Paracraurococcus ruber]|uniref:Uncharacterized protein n=1 Tax=Paracraurococcus ruber TaxID=77675 RepID=A0ABS1CZI0_9PROT|nr:hypothetical protein [Paracraurococcus ruber]MBK1659951.1 hypothetical protein [Paracraurococcus ruber]TDG28847.1 hypothetical protein E2C05_19425 [Paracraurococcus ruber]